MKGIKKINRGLILTVVVLLAVITYLVIISIKINKMEVEAKSFLETFLAADEKYKVIPDEYRDDYEGYLKKIEPEMRNYFADDGAYEYYVENNIHSQYRNNNFYKTCRVFLQDAYESSYNNGVFTMQYLIGINGTLDFTKQENESFRNSYVFSFKQIDGKLKIYYLNYCIDII